MIPVAFPGPPDALVVVERHNLIGPIPLPSVRVYAKPDVSPVFKISQQKYTPKI